METAELEGPDAHVIDFGMSEEADSYVSGSPQDLIRDGYNETQRWLHNGHAHPDDRAAAFLVGRGWSCSVERLKQLDAAGIPWMAVNDYPKEGPTPRYFCCGDGPSLYGTRIWDDPEIMKFCPYPMRRTLLPREDAYTSSRTSMDVPNIHYFYHHNNLMELESWLFVPYIAWGTSITGKKVPPQLHTEGAARSSMLIGLRLLWHLGYREIYLLGCDCTPHHHPAPKYWKVMFDYINKIAPYFDRWGLKVYQTNPDAHLRTFPIVPFDEAIRAV
jgi:hypothetical protein